MRSYGNTVTGTGCNDRGPDLTTRATDIDAPPRPPVRGGSSNSGLARQDVKRRDDAKAARAALAAVGKAWRDVQAWGLERDDYMPADLPNGCINIRASEAYLAWLAAGGES